MNRPPASNLRTLKDPRAGFCLARLQRVVATPVESPHLLKVLATATAGATGAKVQGGFVGSCIGTNQFVQQAMQREAGQTLEATLNEAVAVLGASVWGGRFRRAPTFARLVLSSGLREEECVQFTLADNLAGPPR